MAGDSGAVKAGEAYVEITARDAALKKKLGGARKRVQKFAADITKVGKSMVKVGTVMVAPLALSVKLAADFGKQMAIVNTMLDAAASKEFLPKFSEGISKMSMELGESTATLSQGLYDILSASVDPSKAMGVLEVAAKGAAAGLTSTGVSADAITTILNSYQMSADKAGQVSDVLFSIVARGKTTFAQLAPSIGMVASTASVAGLPLEEMGAALATMTRNGVRTEIAVSSLNAILSSFMKPTDDASKAAKKYGFEMNTATLKTEGFVGVLNRLKGASPEDLAKIFPNVQAVRGVAAVLQDVAGYTKDLGKMYESAGATQEAFGKMSDTLVFQMNQLKQSLIAVAVEIGDALVPAVGEFIKKALVWIKALKEWISKNPKVIKQIGTLVMFVLKLGMALIAAGLALKAFTMIFTGGVWGLAIKAVAALAAAFGAITSGATASFSEIKRMIKETTDEVEKMQKKLAEQASFDAAEKPIAERYGADWKSKLSDQTRKDVEGRNTAAISQGLMDKIVADMAKVASDTDFKKALEETGIQQTGQRTVSPESGKVVSQKQWQQEVANRLAGATGFEVELTGNKATMQQQLMGLLEDAAGAGFDVSQILGLDKAEFEKQYSEIAKIQEKYAKDQEAKKEKRDKEAAKKNAKIEAALKSEMYGKSLKKFARESQSLLNKAIKLGLKIDNPELALNQRETVKATWTSAKKDALWDTQGTFAFARTGEIAQEGVVGRIADNTAKTNDALAEIMGQLQGFVNIVKQEGSQE
ncbi:MAG: phage tail tape measure protein [Gammaproteobacteria bacterium]|nr:MAG: phage tail tape measure protein [Gammaproteobacteria bacterium]